MLFRSEDVEISDDEEGSSDPKQAPVPVPSWRESLFPSFRQSILSGISLVFLCVVTPIFLILGTWGGVEEIINEFTTSIKPFHCS